MGIVEEDRRIREGEEEDFALIDLLVTQNRWMEQRF